MKIDRVEVLAVGPEVHRFSWFEGLPEQFMTNTVVRIYTDDADRDPHSGGFPADRFFCPHGSAAPIPASCDPGTYVPGVFTSKDDCVHCIDGHSCPGGPSQPAICLPGTIAPPLPVTASVRPHRPSLMGAPIWELPYGSSFMILDDY